MDTAVAVFEIPALDTAFAIPAVLGPMLIAVVIAIHLRADDRADRQAADDAGGDRAVIMGERRLRCDSDAKAKVAMAARVITFNMV